MQDIAITSSLSLFFPLCDWLFTILFHLNKGYSFPTALHCSYVNVVHFRTQQTSWLVIINFSFPQLLQVVVFLGIRRIGSEIFQIFEDELVLLLLFLLHGSCLHCLKLFLCHQTKITMIRWISGFPSLSLLPSHFLLFQALGLLLESTFPPFLRYQASIRGKVCGSKQGKANFQSWSTRSSSISRQYSDQSLKCARFHAGKFVAILKS